MWVLLRRHPTTCAAVAYAVLATSAMSPLAGRVTSEVAGGRRDVWQTLWGLWWWHDSVRRGVSPFHCDVLRWPHGVDLSLAGWNLPASIAMFPLWGLTPRVPEVALYNFAVLVAYALSGLGAYLLCRELWGDPLGAFLAGALYAISSYHFGYGLGEVSLASVAAPVYFLALVRVVRRRGPVAPLLGGVALAVTAAASPAHLVACAVATAVLLASWYPAERATLASSAFLHRAALLVAVFLALDGWLLWRLFRSVPPGPLTGAPQSIDLLSFLVPDGATALGAYVLHRPAGAGAYVGYASIAVVVAAVARLRAARPWAAMALLGLLLALGPRLEIAGRALTGPALPFSWLDRVLPLRTLDVSPGRFIWLVALGAAVAAGGFLAQLARRDHRGPLLACAVAALALGEAWPSALASSGWPAPRFLRDLARDGERWAVLDTTPAPRQLWNQLLHGHPRVDLRPDAIRSGDAPRAARARTSLPGSMAGPRGRPAWAQEAIRALQALNVRFVIVDEASVSAARALRLTPAYEGEGLVIFELPPAAG